MAQVVITAGTPATVSQGTTINVSAPALLTGETHAIVVASNQQSVACSVAGYELDSASDVDAYQNRLRRFIRSGPESAATVQVVFNSAVTATAMPYKATGLRYSSQRNTTSQSTFASAPVVPNVFGVAECAVVYEVASGEWPRTFGPPAGSTEIHDSYIYANPDPGAVSLSVGYKNGTAGDNVLGALTVVDPDNPTGDPGDRWRINAVSYYPYGNAVTNSISGDTNVTFVFAPADVVGTAIDDTLNISWSDSNADENAYDVRIRNGDGPWAYVTNLSPVTLSYQWINANPLTTYTLGVRTVRNGDYSAWVDRTITTDAGSIAIAAPSSLTILAITATSVTLGWQSNSTNHSAFEIHGNKTGDAENFWGFSGSPTQTQIVLSGLTPNAEYTFRVRASALPVVSAFSNAVTFSTSGQVTGPGSTSPNIDLVDPCCRVTRNRNLRKKC